MSAIDASATSTLALLEKMKTEMPEIWGKAQVVGKWVWLEFNVPPLKAVRDKLKEYGFHWNSTRRCWQHPCGAPRFHSRDDPRARYQVTPVSELEVKEAPIGRSWPSVAKEYKVVALRECPLPESLRECDNPDKAAEYWRLHVATNPYFDSERECFVVLLLNTRRRVKGHQLVSIGTLDTLLVRAADVFRIAVISSSAAVLLMHNHPSGDPTPSAADIRVTRDLIRAGQLLKIEVLDHVIMGAGIPGRLSLRELGYFAV